MKELIKQLNEIQKELKAKKTQYNKFGKYNYRSCEDILEAVKPLLGNCVLLLTDKVKYIEGRFYIEAEATLLLDDNQNISVKALAREDDSKKGMDVSQLTGATSSYARKYALNGLFCIDDSKDADTQDNRDCGVVIEKTIIPPEPDNMDEEDINKALEGVGI